MTAILLLYSLLSSILQTLLELGSATFLFIAAVPLFLALATNAAHGGQFDEVRFRTYMLASIAPAVVGTEVWCGIADVFVPLVRS